MKPLPPAFLRRMKGLLGEQYPAFEDCYHQPAYVGLRVNTLKLSPGAFLARSPFTLEPVAWCPAGFRLADLSEAPQPGKHPFHAAGLYYLQEPSAMAVAEVLDPQPGERILDLAASPGGKTTHIAACMQQRGLLVANEIRTKRMPALVSNLERWGVRNTLVLNESPGRLADRLGGFFDRVLVDAPCSGEGMFRKDPGARVEWQEAHIPGYAARQSQILNIAARLVRPGGVLVYATCTFAPEENEGVIERFIRANRDFSFDTQIVSAPLFSPPHPEWIRVDPSMQGMSAARIWPHLQPGEGHFMARLRRSLGGDVETGTAPRETVPRSVLQVVQTFFQEYIPALVDRFDALDLAVRGQRLYALPTDLPDLSGLRLPVPGWWLGDVKKNRFEPSHTLGMSLRMEDVRLVLDLPLESEMVIRYLRGLTLESDIPDGWTLIGVEGFTLGWGKVVRGLIKNHYPSGLRWM